MVYFLGLFWALLNTKHAISAARGLSVKVVTKDSLMMSL